MSRLWPHHPELDSASNARNVLQGPWGLSRLPLVFWLGTVLGIIVFFIAIIVRDLGSIHLVETVPTSPFWSFFLGFSSLSSGGLGGVQLRGILLTYSRASLFVFLLSSTRLFLFSPSSPGGF